MHPSTEYSDVLDLIGSQPAAPQVSGRAVRVAFVELTYCVCEPKLNRLAAKFNCSPVWLAWEFLRELGDLMRFPWAYNLRPTYTLGSAADAVAYPELVGKTGKRFHIWTMDWRVNADVRSAQLYDKFVARADEANLQPVSALSHGFLHDLRRVLYAALRVYEAGPEPLEIIRRMGMACVDNSDAARLTAMRGDIAAAVLAHRRGDRIGSAFNLTNPGLCPSGVEATLRVVRGPASVGRGDAAKMLESLQAVARQVALTEAIEAVIRAAGPRGSGRHGSAKGTSSPFRVHLYAYQMAAHEEYVHRLTEQVRTTGEGNPVTSHTTPTADVPATAAPTPADYPDDGYDPYATAPEVEEWYDEDDPEWAPPPGFERTKAN